MTFTNRFVCTLRRTLASGLIVLMGAAPLSSQQPPSGFTFRSQSELVLVNVTVRDSRGNLVRDLKREDFTIGEDNKTQQLSTFDIENTDVVPIDAQPATPLLSATAPSTTKSTTPAPISAGFKDRRLIVLFFDLSSMQPDEIDRAVAAAQNYVDKQMAGADLIAVVCLSNSLKVNLEFTADRVVLKKTLEGFSAGAGEGFDAGSTGTTEGTADTGQAFTVDDTEYNIFNTDRRLEALHSIADRLAGIDQRKSLIYFSGGMDRTGIENQAQLRAATNAAVRANLAIYTMDIRGLQAMVPGGEAPNASLRGTAPYSGQSTLNQYSSNFSSQETLVTLAGDTGGRAFLDSNDFGRVFTGVQQDTSFYYMLGYRSSNPTRDGRFRRITVRVNRPGLKLDFRKGYYAPADFQHSTREDREQQLQDELTSELPSTDLPVYLSAGYFRMSDNRFYIPVSVIVPGNEIPFTRSSDQDKATLNLLGVVLDPQKRPLGTVRDTVKLAINQSQVVQRKNVQYESGFVLPPGKYHLKFVVRENQSGRMGSFETDLFVPDLKNAPLKMSSVVLAAQLQPSNKKKTDNPLVRDGNEIIPSVTHVFSANQHLYLYFEVYDPSKVSTAGATQSSQNGSIKVLTNVAFFRGKSQAYQTALVENRELNAPDRHAAVFQLDVPLSQLKPGFYTCQVNVIDDAGGKFLFPRVGLLVR